MKKIFLMIVLSASILLAYGQKTNIRMLEDVNVQFEGKTVTLYKNEILEKNEEGKLLFFGQKIEIAQNKTVNVPDNEIKADLVGQIENLIKKDAYYKISKHEDGKIYLDVDVTTERNNIPAIIIYPLHGEKINLKKDNKISRVFEDFSYKYIRISVADDNGKVCTPTNFVNPTKFDLLASTSNSIKFVDGKANISSIINPKWKELLTIEPTEGVSYDKNSKDITLDSNNQKKSNLSFKLSGTDLTYSIDIELINTNISSEKDYSGIPILYIILVIVFFIIVLLIIVFRKWISNNFSIFKKRNKRVFEPDINGSFDDISSNNANNNQTMSSNKKQNQHKNGQKSNETNKVKSESKDTYSGDQTIDMPLQTVKNIDLSFLATKQELSTLSSKEDIFKLTDNVNNLKDLVIRLQQDINKSGSTFQQENAALKKEIEIKEIESNKLNETIEDYKKNEINYQTQLIDFQTKLDSSTPKGIIYLGDCTAFVQPNERFLLSLIECEKSLLSYIESVKILSDSDILKGMVAKFYMARPTDGITEWISILENLKMNGMMVHSIKNDLVKEKDKSVIVEILNHKLYEGVYKKYLGALILFLEEIRTANVVGVSSKSTIDLKAKIFEICTGANSLGCKVVYLPLFETLSNQDFNNINIEEDSRLADQYPQYQEDTIIQIINYAVNRDSDVITKSKVVLK